MVVYEGSTTNRDSEKSMTRACIAVPAEPAVAVLLAALGFSRSFSFQRAGHHFSLRGGKIDVTVTRLFRIADDGSGQEVVSPAPLNESYLVEASGLCQLGQTEVRVAGPLPYRTASAGGFLLSYFV